MKLTKAQEKIINNAHYDIDYARNHTLLEWATKLDCRLTDEETLEDYIVIKHWEDYCYKSKEEAIESATESINEYMKQYGKYYENAKNGIVLCHANSKTLKSLEKLGLIEIIKDGRSYIDTIKILNY